MRYEYFIGVDPGIKGALAIIDSFRNILYLDDFPLTITPKAPTYRKIYDRKLKKRVKKRIKGKNRVFDFYQLAKVLRDNVPEPEAALAVVEKVTAAGAREMGAASAFNFGGSFWAIQQALASHGVKFSLVLPREWLTFALGSSRRGLSHDELRKRYLDLARKKFKKANLKRKKDADKAAALLIAEYCLEKFGDCDATF